jgi:hypothetical protein
LAKNLQASLSEPHATHSDRCKHAFFLCPHHLAAPRSLCLLRAKRNEAASEMHDDSFRHAISTLGVAPAMCALPPCALPRPRFLPRVLGLGVCACSIPENEHQDEESPRNLAVAMPKQVVPCNEREKCTPRTKKGSPRARGLSPNLSTEDAQTAPVTAPVTARAAKSQNSYTKNRVKVSRTPLYYQKNSAPAAGLHLHLHLPPPHAAAHYTYTRPKQTAYS